MTEKSRLSLGNRDWGDMLDRTLGRLVTAASVLVLPVSLLLFLQWPLREWVQAYSREANDLAQALFAIYVRRKANPTPQSRRRWVHGRSCLTRTEGKLG